MVSGTPPPPPSSSTPQDGPVAVPRRRKPRTWALRAGAWALLLVATLAAGAVLGWTALAHQVTTRPAGEEPAASATASPAAGASSDAHAGAAPGVLMPDVRGLDRDRALQALADAGIDVADVTTSERQAAGAPGLVVDQSPVFGSSDPTDVSVVTAVQALVPEVQGRSAADVSTEVSALGASVVVQERYQPGAAAGQVLAVDPAVGQPLPAQITLQVAQASSSVFLSTLDAASGGCSAGTAQVDGTAYAQALRCSASTTPRETRWVVGRRADGLQGVVGVPDDADPGTRVRVEVVTDGTSRGAVTAGLGAPAALAVDISGALQVSVLVQRLDAPTSYSSAEAVLGDVRLVGSQTSIAELGASA